MFAVVQTHDVPRDDRFQGFIFVGQLWKFVGATDVAKNIFFGIRKSM